MNSPHILVFDSGLGGLTIYSAILKQFPFASLIYCSDNEAFPYGGKSETELINRVSDVLLTINEDFNPDILVIACNTASTVVLPRIRNLIKQAIVGVVPAIKPAASVAQTTHIGLLATPGTVQRPYTRHLIEQFAPGFQWVTVGSSELVQLAEQKMYGRTPSPEAILSAVTKLTHYDSNEMDTLVLGCTHFPLLKQELKQALPHIKHWIDSSDAIANRVGFWLHELGFQESGLTPSPNKLIFTKKITDESLLQGIMKEHQLTQLNYLPVGHKKTATPK